MSRSEAETGVENGGFYLSLTVPPDFSERLASGSGDLPRAGALRVRTNDANNYVVGQISRTVFSEVRAAVSAKTARSCLDRIFVSFSDIHSATGKAAEGADRLDAGIGKARKGAGALSDGLDAAGNGSAALMSVLHCGLGLRMERAAGTIGFLCLVTLCFTAIVQWLNARFGPAGRILVLALPMLQLTSAGGTYPVQTSPGFFDAVHPYLPVTYVVEGLRRLITGGDLEAVRQGCAVLACFTLAALALTAWSAQRKQVWTLDRLHPELSL